MVYVFTNLGIRVSTNDENAVFRDTTKKGGQLIIEGDEVSFFANIGRAVKVKLVTLVEGVQKAPFSIATPPRCRGRHYSFL